MTKETLKVAVEEKHSQEKSLKVTFIIHLAEYVCAWVKGFMITPEFRNWMLTFHRKSRGFEINQ